jgi:hypothetical protein
MNSIIGFIQRKWAWACQNKLFWANIALALITVAVIFVWPGPVVSGTPSDFRLRAWGMFLQILGAYVVWHDLTGTAREFGADGILRRNWIWLKAGLGFPTVISGMSGAALTGATMSGRMRTRPAIDNNAVLERRVAVLERYVKDIDSDVDGAFAEISQKERELSGKIDAHAGALRATIDANEARLKKAMVGNYSALLFGAVWAFVGIVLSGVASEIAKLVAHQYQAVWMAL